MYTHLDKFPGLD